MFLTEYTDMQVLRKKILRRLLSTNLPESQVNDTTDRSALS